MGTPPAADDSVCPERNVVRESRAAPPTKIACQVLKINVHLSIVIFFHKKISMNGIFQQNRGRADTKGKEEARAVEGDSRGQG